MDAEVECSHSVPDLVTHLATLLLKKELAPHKPTAADVAKKRTRIYEALFLSGSMPTQSKLELFDEVSRELQDDCKHWKSLKDLRVLLGDRTLEESVETEDADNDSAKNYIRVLRPEPLRLVESYEPDTTQEFMKYRFSTVLNSMDQMQRALKPIQLKPLTNFFRMNPISKPPQPLGVKFQLPKTSGFTGIAESMSRMRNSKGQRHFLPFRMPNLKKKQPSVEKEPEFICEAESQKIFMSDHMLTNDLKLYANKDLVLSYIEESVLVEHLKRAAAGLQSETIIISTKDSHKLLLKPHIALRTVLPEVVAEFADPFLRSGRALRRISARVRRSSHMVTRLERPVTRALREALVEFISNSREFLLSIRANSITHLLTCSLPTMLLLQHLEKMFHHEPRLNFDGEVTGPFLLSCIWSAIDNCSNSNFLQLLIYLLRSICQTYFVHLKRWLFQGELDETMNEIFITRSLNSSHTAFDEGSKEFFDRGYMVIKESVPNFLTGCEDDILQCGKYNQVLRAYNPQHPVFDVELPEIVVCLEEQQLKEARRNLAEKYSAIYQRFGWCSMQSIFEKRMAAKRSYKNLMVERTQAYLAAWEENQQILLLEANAQKKLRYEELNNQKALQEKLRLEQRRQEVVRELAFQAECERMEDLKLEKLKPELEMEVANLQRELESDKEYQDMLSPDPSISDRSFVSCMEGPDSQQNSSVENNEEGLDKDPEATDDVESGFLSARGVPYHRTESDVVNSNEQPILQTELSRNRQHMQSSEQFQECQTWVKLNQQSKSQRTESDAPLPSDLNANVSEPLSELQINRLRMNHHDPFESFNSTEDEHMKRMQISLASETERARNRRRVMDSEYNIILGEAWTRKSNNSMNLPLESNKLHVDVSLAMLTPMSTTSDVDIGSLTPAKDTSDSSNNDEANNNNQGIDSHRFPIEKEKVSRCLDQVSASFKPTFLLPTNEILISATKTQTEKLAKGSTPSKIPKNCNPFMIRRCLQLSIMAPVNAHYALLRNEVLRIFQELHIYDHFRKLRNYFFLLDGQFGTLLTCDILGRIKAGVDPRSLCQKGILDAILSHALASGSDEITVAQNLVLNCSTIPDSLNLFSVEATSMLMLHCKVDWPLNLVISPETIAKYGEVFGYLLKLRHVTFVLEGTFDHLQQMGKLLGAELRTASHFRHLQMARHKLAHFMTSLQTHLVANALQGSWEKFKEQLGSVNSIEGLYQEHAMYLKRVAFMAHLNRRSAKVRETIDKMLIIILRFCKVIHSESFIRDNDNDNVFIHPRFKRLMQEEAEFEKFMLYLLYLGNKAATSGYQEEIGDLISVINFNKYYKVADQESVS
ncbi:hypothetical protein KR074_005041 [Drosophila pseudoananassae]|nr:hypothetical protein KR074_005041 [Drosophila pseudoananassae]